MYILIMYYSSYVLLGKYIGCKACTAILITQQTPIQSGINTYHKNYFSLKALKHSKFVT